MLVDRVQQVLHPREAVQPVTAAHHPSAAPAMRRRRAGHRRVIALDGRLDATAVTALIERFWDGVEAGAHEISIELLPTCRLVPGAVEQLVQLDASAYELGRRIVLSVPPGLTRGALRRVPELEVREGGFSSHVASRAPEARR